MTKNEELRLTQLNFFHSLSTWSAFPLFVQGRIQRGGTGGPDPPWNFDKKVVIRFVIGTGLILHSIYVNYSHKSKKGSKCGDLMVKLETLTFLVYGLHPLKSGNQSII